MKGSYIKVPLDEYNEFRCTGGFEIFNVILCNVPFKIDTGCSYTSIPIKRTNLPTKLLDRHRSMDYADANVKKVQSFGANDTAQKRKRECKLFDLGIYTGMTSVSCIKTLKDFRIEGCSLGDLDLKVSYMRDGNFLIGMDILSKMDCHIARINTEETYFVACPLELIKAGQADDYYLELEELYKLGSEINSALVRSSLI